MLNKKPIFINAFARGGSNILMNLFLSHPNVCVSSGETHKVFKGTKWDPLYRKIKKKLCYDLPIRLMTCQNFFNPEFFGERKMVSPIIQRHIDRILYYGRFVASLDTHNKYKEEGVPYEKYELQRCRLLTKGLNGIVFTADIFRNMYPDAVFIALVRNGLAICEGYVRRGYSVEFIAKQYTLVTRKMVELKSKMPNYHLVKYEDMVKEPLGFMQKIYNYAELDIMDVKKVRLQSKKVMTKEGDRKFLKGRDRQLFWYAPEVLHQHIKSDINENQILQLDSNSKEKFLSIAKDAMDEFGYIY